jgi:putative ABC transport system permease protein
MNYFLFIFKTSIDDFRRNKLRTFLTSLGILIGVSSVVLLIAMGLGLKRYIEQQFESMGSNTIFIMPGDISGGGMRSSVSGIKFDDKDVTSLKKLKNTLFTVPFFVKFSKVQGDKDTKTYEIAAGTADMFQMMNIEAGVGRVFDKSTADKGTKVVVLGPKSAEQIFGTVDDALNKTVKIENIGYKVIGVAKPKGGGGGLGAPSVDEHVYMSFKAAASFNPEKKYYAIYVKADRSENIAQIKAEAKKILLKRYKSDEFSVLESTEILNTINSIFGILNTVLVAIAAISLVVGGVGIMNIMFVSVVERIREIGIRRAIGATRKDILLLFLMESVLLSSLGGILALILSFGVVALLQQLFPAYIDLATVIIAIGVSSSVGIIFGVIPARKAANLSPIEAIRYE